MSLHPTVASMKVTKDMHDQMSRACALEITLEACGHDITWLDLLDCLALTGLTLEIATDDRVSHAYIATIATMAGKR